MSQYILQKNGAMYYGMSKLEWKGNGNLTLTSEAVLFQRLFPAKSIEIPISSIKEMKIVSSHMGKTHLMPILRINFMDGVEEKSFGVSTFGAEEMWMKEIEKLRQQVNTPPPTINL
jgi:hypothetical protein